MKIGKALKNARRRKKMTLRQVAAEIGEISYVFLGEIERDAKQPSLDMLKRIAEFYALSIDELLGASAHKKRPARDEKT